MIGETALAGASGASTSQLTNPAEAEAKLAENFDTFLTLLTTQLRNQDPLDPLDSAQFTQQLVQFSQVEQSILANKNFDTLIADVRRGQNATYLNYLGEDVEASGSTTMLSEGQARWNYTLPVSAERAEYAIADSAGKVVAFGEAVRDAGNHALNWDGKSNSGVQLPDGAYTLVVSAFDKTDKPIDIGMTVTGKVTGVETVEGVTSLAMGNVLISVDDILGVRAPATESES